jgi:hypothetical protein
MNLCYCLRILNVEYLDPWRCSAAKDRVESLLNFKNMKKKRIELNQKLFFSKHVISPLTPDQHGSVVGGVEFMKMTFEGSGCPACYEPVVVQTGNGGSLCRVDACNFPLTQKGLMGCGF